MLKKIYISSSLIATGLLAPLVSLAQGQDISTVNTDTAAGVLVAIQTLTNWMFSIFLLIAVLFIIIAAFNFLTSSGNSEKLSSAKKMLVYAIVAVAIAVLAKSFVTVTCAILNAKCTP